MPKPGSLTRYAAHRKQKPPSVHEQCQRNNIDASRPESLYDKTTNMPLSFEEADAKISAGEHQAYDHKMGRTREAPEGDTYQHYQREDQKWKAALNELKYRERCGQLIDARLLKEGLDNLFVTQRTILLSLSSQIGREIDNPADRRRLTAMADRCVREALEAIANYDPFANGQRTDGDGAEPHADQPTADSASAKTDSEPVGGAVPVSQSRRRRKHKVEK